MNPKKKNAQKMAGRVMSITEPRDICPSIEAWHKGLDLGEAYIDGGAQICVITQSYVEKLGLKISSPSCFRIRMANHAKVESLGMVEGLDVEVFSVHCKVDCHVMPAGLGAYWC